MARLECRDALWRSQKRRICRGFGRRRGALPSSSGRGPPVGLPSRRDGSGAGRSPRCTGRSRAAVARLCRSLAPAATGRPRWCRDAGQGSPAQADALVRRTLGVRPTLVQRRGPPTDRRPPAAGRPAARGARGAPQKSGEMTLPRVPGASLAKEASARREDSTSRYGLAPRAKHPAASGASLPRSPAMPGGSGRRPGARG